MNREIIFRAQRIGTKEWLQGDLIKMSKIDPFTYIAIGIGYKIDNPELGKAIKVLPNTVGQFTGLTDKNGTKIFEGDIIKFFTIRFHNKKRVPPATKKWFKSPILWHEGIFLINEGNKIPKEVDDFDTFFNVCFPPYPDGAFEPEIIGNVHDNPELL